MIELEKYIENKFILPAVVDVIYFEDHVVFDVIQLKGEQFKKDQQLKYGTAEVVVHKKLKDVPIQTELSIQSSLQIRKCRYFCNRIKNQQSANAT